jgi:LmbE family N-acetylglucosaminyl deacetylase
VPPAGRDGSVTPCSFRHATSLVRLVEALAAALALDVFEPVVAELPQAATAIAAINASVIAIAVLRRRFWCIRCPCLSWEGAIGRWLSRRRRAS